MTDRDETPRDPLPNHMPVICCRTQHPEDAAWVRDLRDTPLYQCGQWLGGERICMLPNGHDRHSDKYVRAALASDTRAFTTPPRWALLAILVTLAVLARRHQEPTLDNGWRDLERVDSV